MLTAGSGAENKAKCTQRKRAYRADDGGERQLVATFDQETLTSQVRISIIQKESSPNTDTRIQQHYISSHSDPSQHISARIPEINSQKEEQGQEQSNSLLSPLLCGSKELGFIRLHELEAKHQSQKPVSKIPNIQQQFLAQKDHQH